MAHSVWAEWPGTWRSDVTETNPERDPYAPIVGATDPYAAYRQPGYSYTDPYAVDPYAADPYAAYRTPQPTTAMPAQPQPRSGRGGTLALASWAWR